MQHEINSSNLFLRVYDLISALKPLKSRLDRRLNMARFGTCYNLSNEQTQSLIDLLLQIQSFFLDDCEGFRIQTEWRNGKDYLRLVSTDFNYGKDASSKHIHLSSLQAKMLLDLTYNFQHVKIGRGFDPKLVNSNLCQKANELHTHHPYLVTPNGNGVLFPTSLGVQLGAQLRIYNKLNRNVTIIEVDDYTIHIGDEKTNG